MIAPCERVNQKGGIRTIDARKAARKAKILRLGLKIIAAFKYEDIYVFNMVPRNYDRKKDGLYVGGGVLIDANTGKEIYKTVFQLPDFFSLSEEIPRSEYE